MKHPYVKPRTVSENRCETLIEEAKCIMDQRRIPKPKPSVVLGTPQIQLWLDMIPDEYVKPPEEGHVAREWAEHILALDTTRLFIEVAPGWFDNAPKEEVTDETLSNK